MLSKLGDIAEAVIELMADIKVIGQRICGLDDNVGKLRDELVAVKIENVKLKGEMDTYREEVLRKTHEYVDQQIEKKLNQIKNEIDQKNANLFNNMAAWRNDEILEAIEKNKPQVDTVEPEFKQLSTEK